MWFSFKTFVFAGMIAVAAGAGAASAAPTLDQADIPSSGALSGSSSGFGVNQRADLVQTFTVGLTGLLTEFDLAIIGTPLTPDGGFGVSLLDSADNALFSTHVDNHAAPNVFATDWASMLKFQLGSAAFDVAAGDTYRISVVSDPDMPAGTVTWLTGVDGAAFAYAGGEGRVGYGFPPYAFGGDYGFRTYVDADAGAAPEPAAWVLMLLGFGVLGLAIRRRAGRAVQA